MLIKQRTSIAYVLEGSGCLRMYMIRCKYLSQFSEMRDQISWTCTIHDPIYNYTYINIANLNF